MSVGHGCDAKETIADALGTPEFPGRKDVNDEKNEPWWNIDSIHSFARSRDVG
jgi:hypothetical protein